MFPNGTIDAPTIPSRLRRPLAAVWISLSAHAALFAWVQVAPPGSTRLPESVIEARLVSPRADTPHPAATANAPDDALKAAPQRAPSETAEPMPVAAPLVPSAAESAPPVVASQPGTAPAETQPAAVPPAVAITSAVDLTYYSVRDLDQPPRALREIVPDYPAAADRQRLSGTVRLRLELEADGRISNIDVVSAVPPGVFDESAVKALRETRFAPAQRNGRPVRARVLIDLVYDREGRR